MLSGKIYDVDGFIEAIKARPALYDSKHESFSRKDVRAQLWDEIGRIIYPEWDNVGELGRHAKCSFMQKKWKSLKDCFNREIRQQKQGTKSVTRSRKKHNLYDKLSFLLQKTSPKSPKPIEIEEEIVVKLEAPQQETVPELSNQLPAQTVEFSNKRKIEMNNFVKPKQIRFSGDSDSDRLFLMSFIDDFKILPLATKYWVKMKFSEVMHQAAMSLEGLDVGSPVNEFLEDGTSPDSSSSDIFVCQH